jgi:hypothetical protein
MQSEERLACGDLAGFEQCSEIVAPVLPRALDRIGALGLDPFGVSPLPLLLYLLSIRSMFWRHCRPPVAIIRRRMSPAICIARGSSYVVGMIELPPAFAVHCVKDRWFSIEPIHDQPPGRMFDRSELRAVDCGALGALPDQWPAAERSPPGRL